MASAEAFLGFIQTFRLTLTLSSRAAYSQAGSPEVPYFRILTRFADAE